MKKLIMFFAPCLMASIVFAEWCTSEIPKEDIAIVETSVMDAEEWIRTAWNKKVADRKEAIIKEEIQDSLQNDRAIPAKKEDILKNAVKRLGKRKEREAK
jgi:hypothetical protein